MAPDVVETAIREYETVWTSPDRLTPTGLSRYFDHGIGMPPETEEGHFDSVLGPYAEPPAWTCAATRAGTGSA